MSLVLALGPVACGLALASLCLASIRRSGGANPVRCDRCGQPADIAYVTRHGVGCFSRLTRLARTRTWHSDCWHHTDAEHRPDRRLHHVWPLQPPFTGTWTELEALMHGRTGWR